MGRDFQFVTVSNQTGSVPAELRKSAHSHAIRQTHAAQRRLRMQKHQREVMKVPAGENLAVVKPDIAPLSKTLDHSKDVFSALPRTLSSQEYFLLDHYLHTVVPYAAKNCELFRGQLLREWVDLVLTDKDLFDSAVLLCGCRSVLRDRPDDPTLMKMALYYRQKGLQALRQSINGVFSWTTLLTIAKAVALVMDEVATGEIDSARQHLKAMYLMAKVGVDPHSAGLSGVLAMSFFTFSDAKMLEDETIIARCSNRPLVPQLIEPIQ